MTEHSKLESYIAILEAVRDNARFPEWIDGGEINYILDSLEKHGSIQCRPLRLTEKGVQSIKFFRRAEELDSGG